MGDAFKTEHWPLEINYDSKDKRLRVEFDDGRTFFYPAELDLIFTDTPEQSWQRAVDLRGIEL